MTFRKLVLQVPTLSEPDKIHCFTSGLRPNVALQVRIQNPSTLEQAMAIAARADDPKHHYPVQHFSRSNEAGPVPMEMGVRNTQRTGGLQKKYNLTFKELGQLFDDNKCFRCKQPGHIARYCPKKTSSPKN
jgi:hypothetical protein